MQYTKNCKYSSNSIQQSSSWEAVWKKGPPGRIGIDGRIILK
jgi:hypothetical protein